MKFIRFTFYPVIVLIVLVCMQACKAKKIVEEPPYRPSTANNLPDPVDQKQRQQPAPVTQQAAAPVPPPAPAPVQQANFNFSNIQFEFNSGILTTNSYPVLDQAASAMKTNPSLKFNLNGYASAEGTADHNMELSIARSNAVKAYLVNSGISSSSLIVKGFGEANPVADNTTDDGKILNRRVEIKVQN